MDTDRFVPPEEDTVKDVTLNADEVGLAPTLKIDVGLVEETETEDLADEAP